MPNRSRKTNKVGDFNPVARSTVDRATGVAKKKPAKPAPATTKRDAADIDRAASEGMAQPQALPVNKKRTKKKDPAAVELGRKGGLKGGKARASRMTKEELSESARKAARARWRKKTEGP